MDDGTVSLQLLAGNPATREALRASLGVLRSDLAAAGLDGTRLDVSDQPPSQQGTAAAAVGRVVRRLAALLRRLRPDGRPRCRRPSPASVRAHRAAGADVRPRPPGPCQGVDLRL